MISRYPVPWLRRALALATCIVLPSAPLLVIAACAASNETDGPDADGPIVIPSGDGGESSVDAAAEGDAPAVPCDVGGSLCSAPTTLTFGNVVAIGGRSKNDVWASASGGQLMHWDGQQWTALDSVSGVTLSSIFLMPDEMWGIAGHLIVRRRLARDSIRTADVTAASAVMAYGTSAPRGLSGIAVLPGGDVYVSFAPLWKDTPKPVAKLTFDTSQLEYLPDPVFPWADESQFVAFRASFLVPGKALWVVGDRAIVARYPVSSPGDGGAPTLGRGVLLPIASQINLRAAWGEDEHLWVAGNHGAVFHFDGTEWHTAETGTDVTLNAIFGISANDIWAAGDDGVVLHFDGNTWSRVAVGAYRGSLQAIWGALPDDVWIGGEDGMFHWGALP